MAKEKYHYNANTITKNITIFDINQLQCYFVSVQVVK